MAAWRAIQPSRRIAPALVVVGLAARAVAQSAPQHGETPAPFAAAGTPREEEEASNETAPKPHLDGPAGSAHHLVLPDDVPVKASGNSRAPFALNVALEGHLGLGTPVGAAGLMLEYSILPELAIAAGGGIGSGVHNNFHGALAVRTRPAVTPTDHNAMVLEAAFSTGGYQRFEFPSVISVDGSPSHTPTGPSAEWAHFLHLGAAWEHRSDKGFLVRVGGGIAIMLNPDALHCVADAAGDACAPTHDGRPDLVAVLDFAIGHAF